MSFLEGLLVFISASAVACVIRSPVWRARRPCLHLSKLLLSYMLFGVGSNICVIYLLTYMEVPSVFKAAIVANMILFTSCIYATVYVINHSRIEGDRRRNVRPNKLTRDN